jgi:predicted ferric reductase
VNAPYPEPQTAQHRATDARLGPAPIPLRPTSVHAAAPQPRPQRPGGAVRYQGLDPRASAAGWGLFLIGVGFVVGATAPGAVQSIIAAASAQQDKLPWYGTRISAFLAYLAVAGSVIYGLLLTTKLLDAIAHRPVTFALHKDLALIGLGLAGVHAFLLTLDSSVPFSLADLLVPFQGPYRPLWVGIGQIAFYLALVVVAGFYVRGRIGQRAWRLVHYVTFLAFLASTVHGLQAGSDSGTPWARSIYVGATVVVVFLLVYRVTLSVSLRRSRIRTPAAAHYAAPGAGLTAG